MPLTTQQKATVKTWLDANAVGQSDDAAALLLNAKASPDYWAWRTSVSRSEIYNLISDAPSSWDWTFYKNQSATEQNAWVQMFMGDQADFSKMNLRGGIGKIFTAGASVNRDHAFAIGRRTVSVLEKLFVVAVTSPQSNSGNDGVVGNRGKVTNPDVMGFEGTINAQTVSDIRGGL